MMSILGIHGVIFCFLVFCWLVQLFFLWGIFARFIFSTKKNVQKFDTKVPVSVIICAKNESRYLKKFLPLILEQEYPCFEVVVVNDNSDDDIENIIKFYQQQYSNLQLASISTNIENNSGKKLALALGVKSAQYDLLLLTDADCVPKSRYWITNMVAAHQQSPSFVLGYGAYETKNGFLDKLIRFDTLHTAIQYFAMAKIGHPYMGVGRNLMYDKELFTNNYQKLLAFNSISGDDDLFVNMLATKKNTFSAFQPEAHTISLQKHLNFSSWLLQKKRHLSASKYYKKIDKFILGNYWFSNFLLYFFLVLALFLYISKVKILLLILSLYVTKILSQFILFAKASKIFEEKHIAIWMPVLDIFFVLLLPLLQTVLLIKKQKRWN